MIGNGATSARGCRTCPIRTRGVCSTLSASGLETIERMRDIPRRLAAGQDVFRQGEPLDDVFNILDGWAILYEILEDGRRQIIRFAIPGDLVGFRAGSHASMFGAQAISAVELCVIPRRRLMALAHDNADFALRLVTMLSIDEHLAYERITSIGRKTALERIAALLLELFYRLSHRAPSARGEELRIPLTQPLIADATGLTPIHTNRMLGELRSRRIIDYGNGLFRILDPGRLFAVAGIDPEMCPWSPEEPAIGARSSLGA